MKTYLVTGAAGFIGANYIKYILAKHDDIRVVILDALTYAGNLGTVAKDIDDERCFFVKGDICDRILADELFAKYKFDYVVNFAAESHVDRSIENPQLFLMTNILGTQNLLDAARRAWVTGRTNPVILPGVTECAIIRCLLTKFTVRWERKVSSRRIRRCVRIARTVRLRPVPIWW